MKTCCFARFHASAVQAVPATQTRHPQCLHINTRRRLRGREDSGTTKCIVRIYDNGRQNTLILGPRPQPFKPR